MKAQAAFGQQGDHALKGFCWQLAGIRSKSRKRKNHEGELDEKVHALVRQWKPQRWSPA